MKRIFALVIALVFALSSASYGQSLVDTIASSWKTVVVDNSTGMYINHSVPTTTIVPEINMILGVCIMPYDGTKNSETVIALYDTADITNPGNIVSDEVFDEAEADGTSSFPSWYPYPRMILTQLAVRVGPNTRAIIYYE